jgi:hypothetical protein
MTNKETGNGKNKSKGKKQRKIQGSFASLSDGKTDNGNGNSKDGLYVDTV